MVSMVRPLVAAAGTCLAAFLSRMAAGEPNAEGEPGPVAILVLDDFGLCETVEAAADGNCTKLADGQVFAAGGAVFAAEGAGLVDISQETGARLAHGDLVWKKFRDVLGQIGGAQEQPDKLPAYGVAWMPRESVWHVGGQELRVVAVNAASFNTDVIRDRIRDSLILLKDKGFKRFVLNMSFAIMPCTELEEEVYTRMVNEELADLKRVLQESGLDDDQVEEALKGLVETRDFYLPPRQEGPYGEEKPQLPRRILEELAGDPLRQFFQEPQPELAGLEIINVAAAGNAALGYPYAPALWENVLSVSAPDGEKRYANRGEVIAGDVVAITNRDGNPVQVPGTSFAAPEVSVRAALYLARGGKATCPGGEKTTTPPLAYAPETGPWDNLTLSSARVKFCHNFPANLP